MYTNIIYQNTSKPILDSTQTPMSSVVTSVENQATDQITMNAPGFGHGKNFPSASGHVVYDRMSSILVNEPDLMDEFINFLPEFVLNEISDSPDTILKLKRKQPSLEETSPKTVPIKIKVSKNNLNDLSNSVAKLQTSEDSYQSPMDDYIPYFQPNWFLARDVNSRFFDENLFKTISKTIPRTICTHLMRCISLFNMSHLSPADTITLLHQALKDYPTIFLSIKKKITEGLDLNHENNSNNTKNLTTDVNVTSIVANNQHIEFHLSKRIGQSYWPYKKGYNPPKSSGRTSLAEEVLNDYYVSQPILTEDTPFPGSKKTLSLEALNLIEQERYDLDMIKHSNREAVAFLENLQIEINSGIKLPTIDLMPNPDSSFSVINCLKALQRIYGEHISLIVEGLKNLCHETLRMVIKSLKVKGEEISDNQHRMNLIWWFDIRKHSLKSLDFQGPSFKISDTKDMRVKHMVRELELNEDCALPKEVVITFNDQEISLSALHFIKYSVKKLTNVNKTEKIKINSYIKIFHGWIFKLSPDMLRMTEEGLAEENNAELPEFKNSTQFYVTTNIYVYLRLYHLLVKRLSLVHEMSDKNIDTTFYQNLAFFTNPLPSSQYNFDPQLKGLAHPIPRIINSSKNTNKADIFDQFQNMVYNLIDGNIDNDYYEECCRCIFGLDSYVLFTIDKIISGIMRQLNYIAVDSSSKNLLNDLSMIVTKYPINPDTGEVINQLEFIKYWKCVFENDSCYSVLVKKDGNSVSMKFRSIDTGMKHDTSELDESADEEWADYIADFVSLEKEHFNNNRRRCYGFSGVFLNKNQIK
ncbi:hypothetical protein HZS_7881, partial [Henneguya salminicola]